MCKLRYLIILLVYSLHCALLFLDSGYRLWTTLVNVLKAEVEILLTFYIDLINHVKT